MGFWFFGFSFSFFLFFFSLWWTSEFHNLMMNLIIMGVVVRMRAEVAKVT
jgi:hypothetical protein